MDPRTDDFLSKRDNPFTRDPALSEYWEARATHVDLTPARRRSVNWVKIARLVLALGVAAGLGAAFGWGVLQ